MPEVKKKHVKTLDHAIEVLSLHGFYTISAMVADAANALAVQKGDR